MVYAAFVLLLLAVGSSASDENVTVEIEETAPPVLEIVRPPPVLEIVRPPVEVIVDPRLPGLPPSPQSATYAVYVPKNIRIGIPFSIDVEILPDYDGSVDIEATLTPYSRANTPSFDFTSTATATVASGETKTIQFDPIPYGVVSVRHFQVSVIGRNSTSGVVIFNESTTEIQFQKKFISIFIQTDKAIYQPGQTIKFRGVVTTPDLRPFDGLINFKLEDPRGNILMRERNATLTQGVHGAEFTLGRRATQGSWKITYEVHGYQQYITVSVEEYKLPKFSVEIKTDQAFLHPDSKALTGEVKALYTFGQPVKGTAYIEASIRSWRGPSPKIRIEFPEFDGSAQFEISRKEVTGTLGWRIDWYSQPINLFASVTEKGTGEKFNETKRVQLERVKNKVEALAKPDHVKPGLPYTAYLKVSEQDGSDLSPEELSELSLFITIEYQFQYNYTSWTRKPTIKREQKLVIGDGGLIVFDLVSEPGDWESIYFSVRSYNDENTYWTGWSAQRFESPSDTFLQVSTKDSTLTVGDTATVTVATTHKPESSTYRISVVARGRIVKNELFVPKEYTDAKSYESFEYQFLVESHYAPSIYVLVSFVTATGEFVADTVKINVQAKLDNEVTMTTSTEKTDAGMPVSITITADPGSYVGLRAIDQSVLLLKSGNDITRSKIFTDLDQYGVTGGYFGGFQPFGRWWWPWPVGGGDVKEVFRNSGFIVLTDGLLYQAPPEYYPWVRGPTSRRIIGGALENRALAAPPPASAARQDAQSGQSDAAAATTRSFFPESWIWSEKTTSQDLLRLQSTVHSVGYTLEENDTDQYYEYSALSGPAFMQVDGGVPVALARVVPDSAESQMAKQQTPAEARSFFPESWIWSDDIIRLDYPIAYSRSLGIANPPLHGGTAQRARSFFPETWIWTDSIASDDGSVTFNYKTPDTITTWELSSFAVSNSKGLGVTAQNSEITVFRSFFISLNLPPSAVRGEILSMKTTLFNYFDVDVNATLVLGENEWYDLIIPTGASAEVAGPIRQVLVPSKDSVTIVLPIKFRKVGRSKIAVQAFTALAGDAVERTLLVKPEGVSKIVSHSQIISRELDTLPPSVFTFDVDIPSDAVEGSVYVKCSVSGNILGSSLSNIGSLLRMPSGCGEQTMINFAPSVFVSKYLKEADELTGQFKQKSEQYIRGGYQNELRYQRKDGSFSAFGARDKSGSTWLTAFVVKCFIAANDLNPDLIEESKIRQAVSFMLKQQNKDGTFNEPGRVIHQSMQGGVDSNETVAAYMLIALTEGNMYGPNSKDDDVKAAIAKTQKYLESKVDFIDDLYTLSIAGYALALLQSEKAGSVMARLDTKAIVENNVKYWKKEESGAAKCDSMERYCPFDYNKPSSSSVESTSYILLTYVKMGRVNEVMPIVRWLVQQKGAFGGYHSTQDTVMAIQALATVAGHFSGRKLDMTVNIAHDGQPDYAASFKLSEDNAIVLQMAELPSLDGTVTVTATGTGVGDVQLAVGYNLPVGPRADEPFIVDVDVNETPDHRVLLRICSRINDKRTEVLNGTGMYVVTFTLPTGYTIDEEQATNDNPKAKLVEVEGEDVTGYFDELPRGQTLCLDLILIRYAEVAAVKPKMVVAFDYYKPEIQAMRPLALKSDEDICHVCGSACAGCKALPERNYDITGCGPSTFPCPDFHNGLFYDSGSEVMRLSRSLIGKIDCIAPLGAEDSSRIRGPPASLLNGVNQFVVCANSTFFKQALSREQGFTISLAVKPQQDDFWKYYVVYSIASSNTTKPHVILSKRRRSRQYWFRVLLNGYQLTLRGIQSTDIPLNTWSLITAKAKGKSATVYVNGKKLGVAVRWKASSAEVKDDVSMMVGQSHFGAPRNRGFFKGLISGLSVWDKALTGKEIIAHYMHYQRIIQEANPVLSRKQAHYYLPEPVRKCFSAETYLASVLKNRAGVIAHSCPNEPPLLPPPPQPIA